MNRSKYLHFFIRSVSLQNFSFSRLRIWRLWMWVDRALMTEHCIGWSSDSISASQVFPIYLPPPHKPFNWSNRSEKVGQYGTFRPDSDQNFRSGQKSWTMLNVIQIFHFIFVQPNPRIPRQGSSSTIAQLQPIRQFTQPRGNFSDGLSFLWHLHKRGKGSGQFLRTWDISPNRSLLYDRY
jgi:hypothetical protein